MRAAVVLVVGTVLAIVAAAPAAQAGVLTKVDNKYVYTSGTFEEDNIVIDFAPHGAGSADDQFEIFNSPSTISNPLPPGCTRFPSDPSPFEHAQCLASGIGGLEFQLGGRDDAWKNLTDLGDAVLVEVHGGEGNDFFDSRDGGEVLLGENGEDVIDDSTSDLGDDHIEGGPGNDTIFDGSGKDDISGGDGTDLVDAFASESVRQEMTLDDVSNDGAAEEHDNYRSDVENLTGGRGVDVMTGDGDANVLDGGDGADVLDGGAGADELIGGEGADDLIGGADFDKASYPETSAPDDPEGQTITIDDVADDGLPSEGDNVRTSIEDISAGPGDDVVTGSAVANTLDGGDGLDKLTGGGGVDTLFGGAGPDQLDARDGLSERVDCGADGASAKVDTIDNVLGCPSVDASDELVPDIDGDGSTKPADCNDRDPAIGPSAIDVPDNGVDEDCKGGDAINLDRDGDGALRGVTDCDDGNRNIRQGATDVPENGVDEDCNGVDAEAPLITGDPSIAFSPLGKGRGARVIRLGVSRLRPGSKITFTCKLRRCKVKKRTVTLKSRSSKLSLNSLVKNLVVRPREGFEMRLESPGYRARIWRFRWSGKRFTRTDLCISRAAPRGGPC